MNDYNELFTEYMNKTSWQPLYNHLRFDNKLSSTEAGAIINEAMKGVGRLQKSSTGRISCKEPNFTNVPKNNCTTADRCEWFEKLAEKSLNECIDVIANVEKGYHFIL